MNTPTIIQYQHALGIDQWEDVCRFRLTPNLVADYDDGDMPKAQRILEETVYNPDLGRTVPPKEGELWLLTQVKFGGGSYDRFVVVQ